MLYVVPFVFEVWLLFKVMLSSNLLSSLNKSDFQLKVNVAEFLMMGIYLFFKLLTLDIFELL